MKTKRLFKDRKGVSPVIATVILVSVTIVVAIAVAYWMTGIAGIYTRFEKMEIITSYADKNDKEYDGATTDPLGSHWDITVDVKNTGSDDGTITSVLVNGKRLGLQEYYVGEWVWFDGIVAKTEDLTIKAGGSNTILVTLYVHSDDPITIETVEYDLSNNPEPGVSIEIKLKSAAGKEYPLMLNLP